MTGSKTQPTIIDLPGGDAILASKINLVCVRLANTDGLGTDWPSRVQVNGGEYTCEDDSHAVIERDRIIAEWKTAIARLVGEKR